ncbi:MAG: hypothetical protein QOG53_1563 [Frankiales bacterium]|jgi:hypothetical protein|nr:hypothetical protein [Frankiales bacterium]
MDDTGERLSPDEDAALRRLHWFEQLGCDLSGALRTLKDGFRGRDRRAYVRDPFATWDQGEQRVKSEPTPNSYWVRPKR